MNSCYLIDDSCQCGKNLSGSNPCFDIGGGNISGGQFGDQAVGAFGGFLGSNPGLVGALGLSLGVGFLMRAFK